MQKIREKWEQCALELILKSRATKLRKRVGRLQKVMHTHVVVAGYSISGSVVLVLLHQ